MPTASTFDATHGTQTIVLADYGPDASGRTRGAAVRNAISPEASAVIFDCGGLESMAPGFADEVFGKLVAQSAPRPAMRVINAGTDVRDTIRFVVAQRTRG
jgi:STAS-like domain of unknown function (DUF4325)